MKPILLYYSSVDLDILVLYFICTLQYCYCGYFCHHWCQVFHTIENGAHNSCNVSQSCYICPQQGTHRRLSRTFYLFCVWLTLDMSTTMNYGRVAHYFYLESCTWTLSDIKQWLINLECCSVNHASITVISASCLPKRREERWCLRHSQAFLSP